MEGKWDTVEYFAVVHLSGETRMIDVGAFRNRGDAWGYFNVNFPDFERVQVNLIDEKDARKFLATLKEFFE